MIYKNRNKLIEFGGHMVAVFLPLFFNPYARQSIEAGKANLFLLIAFGMLIVAIVAIYQEMEAENAWGNWRSFAKERLNHLLMSNRLLIPGMVYAAIYILASVFSIDPSTSWWGISTKQGTLTVLYSIIFFVLLTSAIQSKGQIERLITSLIIGSIPTCIYGLVQYFGFDPLNWDTGSISLVHSTLGYSLFFGAYLAVIAPFTLSRIIAGWGEKDASFWIYLSVLLLQVFTLFTTLARGAWLGFLTGSIVCIWLLLYRWREKKLAILSGFIILIGGLLFLFLNTGILLSAPGSTNSLSDTRIAQARVISNFERLEIWRHSLPVILRRPFLGYGPETYLTAFWSYYPIETNPNLEALNPWDPHNLFLYHLTAVGILGTMVLLWLLVSFYRQTISTLIRSEGRHLQVMISAVVGSLSAYIILAQFNPVAITSMVLFWFVMALGAALSRTGDLSLK